MKIIFKFFIVFLLCSNIGNAQELAKSHTVKEGETVYHLSRVYHVSPQDIIKLNPNSEKVIRVGDVLTLPDNAATNLNNTIIHNVSKGETKYSLSKKYNITIADLESANPKLGVLKYDSSIVIPVQGEVVENNSNNNQEEPVLEETTIALNEEENYILTKKQEEENVIVTKTIQQKDINRSENYNSTFKNLRLTINKNSAHNILLLLPFTEAEFTQHEKNSKDFSTVSNITLKQKLEFYRGTKIAIDSIRKLGINLKTKIISVDESSSSINNSITNEDYTAVIALYNYANLDGLSKTKIPVISFNNTSSNKTFFNMVEAFPNSDHQRKQMLEYLQSQNGNIVVISGYSREESRNFIKNNTHNAHIIETQKNGDFLNSDLTTVLDKTKSNFVIIDSEQYGVFLNATNILLRELSQYKIQLAVLDSKLIPSEESISYRRFKILKLLYPEIDYITNSIPKKQFSEKYKDFYNSEITDYVLYGFDITIDSMLRLSQVDGFENSLKQLKTEQVYLKFVYNKNEMGTYSNDSVVIREFDETYLAKKTN